MKIGTLFGPVTTLYLLKTDVTRAGVPSCKAGMEVFPVQFTIRDPMYAGILSPDHPAFAHCSKNFPEMIRKRMAVHDEQAPHA